MSAVGALCGVALILGVLYVWAKVLARANKRQGGSSHRVLERAGWPDCVFAFHDGDEIGPKMLGRIAKRTGLVPTDL